MDDEMVYRLYRCYMRSAPGMWATYDGYVEVRSPDKGEVFERAVRQLARTSFSDRPGMDSWRLERIELLE